MLYVLVLGGSFFTAVLMVMGVHALVFGSRATVLRRLTAYTEEDLSHLEQDPDIPRRLGLKHGLLHFLGKVGVLFSLRSKRRALQQKLNQAHILMRAEELIGFSLVLGGLVFMSLFLVANSVLPALGAGLLGFLIPGILVERKKKKRMTALGNQLPEALNTISNGLRAGFSFLQAMSVVSKEMTPPIKEEISRVIWENRMGKALEEAFHNLQERTENDDLDLFITAILIQKQVGGNLAEVMDNLSHTIRERVRIKGEIKTLTTQGRISALIIIFLPLALAAFLFLLNPDYIMLLFQETLGRIMLGAAMIMQIVGIVIIQRIVNIDV